MQSSQDKMAHSNVQVVLSASTGVLWNGLFYESPMFTVCCWKRQFLPFPSLFLFFLFFFYSGVQAPTDPFLTDERWSSRSCDFYDCLLHWSHDHEPHPPAPNSIWGLVDYSLVTVQRAHSQHRTVELADPLMYTAGIKVYPPCWPKCALCRQEVKWQIMCFFVFFYLLCLLGISSKYSSPYVLSFTLQMYFS